MPSVEEFGEMLSTLAPDPVDYLLTRIVPYLSYRDSEKPSFLFTSGRPNRCNPSELHCIYLSQTKTTAQAEYDAHDKDPTQPTLTYHGRLQATRIVDLEDPDLRSRFRIPDEDFRSSFYLGTLDLQRLGKAISVQKRIAAIRYPSRAMNEVGKKEFNLAIFPSAIAAPDSLAIYGQGKEILEEWPKD